MGKTGKLVVITGPSGVGKSTVVREVLARTGATYSVSATTRSPRPGEADGGAYSFVDRETFEAMVQRDEMLEWAEVFGRLYGTPVAPVRDAIQAGRTVVLEIDVQGGLQVAAKMPEARFVLLLPPDQQELARRLRGRATEDAGQLAARLAKANEEIRAAKRSGVYNHEIVNRDLQTAIRQVVEIVNQEHSSE